MSGREKKKTRRQTGQLILHEKLFRLDVIYLFNDKMNLTATFIIKVRRRNVQESILSINALHSDRIVPV
jgi:hypothetical protein